MQGNKRVCLTNKKCYRSTRPCFEIRTCTLYYFSVNHEFIFQSIELFITNHFFKIISWVKGKATSSFLICLTVECPASKAHKLTKAIAPCVAKAIHFPSKSLLLHSIMKNIQTANPQRFIQEQSVRTGRIFLQEAKINAKLNQNWVA